MLDTKRYAEFVCMGNFTKSNRDSKFLAAMGLCGEAGEVSEILKKHLLHGNELNKEDLKKELGDVLWYFFHTLNVFEFTIEEIAKENVKKLCDRYAHNREDWVV